jgi:beta-lactam-binding protein with PASTA domain
VQVVDQPTSDVTEDGLVVAQDPPGGTQADEGSVVTITVARLS